MGNGTRQARRLLRGIQQRVTSAISGLRIQAQSSGGPSTNCGFVPCHEHHCRAGAPHHRRAPHEPASSTFRPAQLTGTGYVWRHGKTSDTLTNFPAWACALCILLLPPHASVTWSRARCCCRPSRCARRSPSSPAIASRWLIGERGGGLWLGASIALTRVRRLR